MKTCWEVLVGSDCINHKYERVLVAVKAARVVWNTARNTHFVTVSDSTEVKVIETSE